VEAAPGGRLLAFSGAGGGHSPTVPAAGNVPGKGACLASLQASLDSSRLLYLAGVGIPNSTVAFFCK
jgi:hypothetical protein